LGLRSTGKAVHVVLKVREGGDIFAKYDQRMTTVTGFHDAFPIIGGPGKRKYGGSK
jgi:hypothetical protein